MAVQLSTLYSDQYIYCGGKKSANNDNSNYDYTSELHSKHILYVNYFAKNVQFSHLGRDIFKITRRKQAFKLCFCKQYWFIAGSKTWRWWAFSFLIVIIFLLFISVCFYFSPVDGLSLDTVPNNGNHLTRMDYEKLLKLFEGTMVSFFSLPYLCILTLFPIYYFRHTTKQHNRFTKRIGFCWHQMLRDLAPIILRSIWQIFRESLTVNHK